jgi:hypothetical protein
VYRVQGGAPSVVVLKLVSDGLKARWHIAPADEIIEIIEIYRK